MRAKATATSNPISDYIAALEPDRRDALERVRKAVLEVAPDAVEGMSYGMPAFKLDGRGIAGVANFKDHLSFFPMSGTVIDQLGPDVLEFRTTKGTLQFTVEKPLPIAVIKKVVKARIAEMRGPKGR